MALAFLSSAHSHLTHQSAVPHFWHGIGTPFFRCLTHLYLYQRFSVGARRYDWIILRLQTTNPGWVSSKHKQLFLFPTCTGKTSAICTCTRRCIKLSISRSASRTLAASVLLFSRFHAQSLGTIFSAVGRSPGNSTEGITHRHACMSIAKANLWRITLFFVHASEGIPDCCGLESWSTAGGSG